MSFYEEHKVISTIISLTIAFAAIALLFYLSSTADDTVPQAPEDQYTETTTGDQPEEMPDGTTVAVEVREPGDIQQVDFSQMLAPRIADDQVIEGMLLLDVDGNGSQEALLLIRGTGERRPLDWYLYGLAGGSAQALFEHLGIAQGEVTLDGPRIVEEAAAYQPGDAECCPSQVTKTYYVWKEGGLQVSKTEVSPAGSRG